jgi:hypothetical protein
MEFLIPTFFYNYALISKSTLPSIATLRSKIALLTRFALPSRFLITWIRAKVKST